MTGSRRIAQELRLTLGLAVALGIALFLLVQGAGAQGHVGTTCYGQPVTIIGTDNDDTLAGTPGNDVIVAGGGTDIVFAGAGDDLVCGEDGGDFLFGQAGNDSLDGGTGGDSFLGGSGDDKMIGGEGGDLIAYLDAPRPVTVSLVTRTATGDGNDTFETVESLAGGPFDDALTGDAGEFNGLIGGPGNDVLDGGPGFDGAIFATGPIRASLRDGTATGEGNDTLRGIEGLEGTTADDTFIGDDGSNVLDGRGGADVLQGLGSFDLLQGDALQDENPGDDRLDGGAGDDFLQPSPGSDTIGGGAGRLDLLDFSLATSGVTANLATGKISGPGTPRLLGIEGFSGSAFADNLTGNAGPNVLLGGDGVDRLQGAAGDDFLSGGAGADTFDGGTGTDYCLDGRGRGCEFTGLPGSSPSFARSAGGFFARVAGENTALGEAGCAGSQPGNRSVAAGVRERKASARPPHKTESAKSTKPDASRAGTALTWRGTLMRFDPAKKLWRPYKSTVTATGSVDPSGTTIWTGPAGAKLDTVTFSVPAGRFAWKATLSIPGLPAVTDWIEPHTDYGRQGGGVFAPSCTFLR